MVIIQGLVNKKFWGVLTIRFENGKIMPIIKQEENINLVTGKK